MTARRSDIAQLAAGVLSVVIAATTARASAQPAAAPPPAPAPVPPAAPAPPTPSDTGSPAGAADAAPPVATLPAPVAPLGASTPAAAPGGVVSGVPAPPVSEAPTAATEPEGLALGEGHDPDDDDGKKKKKKKKDQIPRVPGEFSVKGRVFVLAELSRHERTTTVVEGGGLVARTDNPTTLDLSVPTARASLRYQAPQPWLSAEVEIEVADGPAMRDGYVQAKGRHLSAKLGQFKLPVSAFAMESLWDLPLVRRGFLHDLLDDWLDVGGRQPGVLFGVRGRGGMKPFLSLGAFQGNVVEEDIVPGDRNTDPVSLDVLRGEGYLDAQSYVARAGFELADFVDLGLWYQHRVGSPAVGEIEHYPTAGFDAVVDEDYAFGGVRLWLDAMLGESWYEHPEKVEDDDDALFLAGRLVAAVRFGGLQPDEPYVEPYGLVSAFEPDPDVVSDFAYEAALGVNVGLWDRARIGLQGELVKTQRNFPGTLAGYFGGRVPDRLGLLLQGAVQF